MHEWAEIWAWRRERRRELIARRRALPAGERRSARSEVLRLLYERFTDLSRHLVGLYWPIRGEIGLQPLIRRLAAEGTTLALPVVVEKARPLEFRAWRPDDPLERGVWDIPVPVARRIVRPSLLLVPLVGFDGEGYRLGYGGGYYDRTLAAMDPRPVAIGIGYDFGRLDTIHPQPHDIPMDAVITEAGDSARTLRAADEIAGYASPACSMHEVDPDYFGLDDDRPGRGSV